MIDLNRIELADRVLQEEIRLEKEEVIRLEQEEAEKASTFKTGDIVRAVVNGTDQAAMIVKVTQCDKLDELDTFTMYVVAVKYGRRFTVCHIEGEGEDAYNDGVRLIDRASNA